MNPNFVALEREPNSVDEEELDREIQELTACYERVKSEYEKRKSANQNKNAKLGEQASVDNRARVDNQVTFKNLAQSSTVSLNTSSQSRETEIETVQRNIKELERQELELSIALQRSQLDAYKSTTNIPNQEESSLCGTRSRRRSKENTLPMNLKWIFIRNAYHIWKNHSA
jgi:lysyl-tRNA synthetase class I